MNVVFMGTPEIAMEILKSLKESDNNVIGVVCQPDSKSGRGNNVRYSEVKEYALENNLKLMQPLKVRNNEEFLSELKELNPDVICVCAYGKIIPKEVLNLPKYGCINVHASLLPRLRGASPIQSAILLGEEKTGITIMKMAEGIDDGDMILKGEVQIGQMNYEELYKKLTEMGKDLIIKALKEIEDGTAKYEKQDSSLATYVTTIDKKDGKIDFSLDAIVIERKVRAFDPWPGAFCELNGVVYKFWKVEVVSGSGKPGEILSIDNNGITVSCGKDAILVKELQIPGKKRVSVKDFLLGHKINLHDTFIWYW